MSRLLLVDDDRDVADMMRQYLEEEGGHVVTIAHDGIEALRCLALGAFDLVITDLMMPGMTGWELLRHIDREFPLVARMVVSAVPESHRNTQAPAMQKPVSLKDMLVQINKLTGALNASDSRSR